MIRIGLDVGSTTLKSVVLNEDGEILYQQYERHFSQITSKVNEMLSESENYFLKRRVFAYAYPGRQEWDWPKI